jgi:type I restriction enzyme S subunit
VLGGGTPSKNNPNYWNGNIPWVTAKEMWNDEILDSELKITEQALKASPTKLIPVNSVLFVVRGSILFKRVPVAINRVICTINQDMKAIVPDDDINGDYLAVMMRAVNDELKSRVGTAGNSAGKLETDEWSSVEIPVPSPAEQRRLVARIEALTSRLEQAGQVRQAALAEAESAQAALVDAVFAERNGDWNEATVKQLCGQPQYGYTESASHEQVGPLFLRITDIQDGNVNWETVPFCVCDEPAKYRLNDGDIVFARTGATTGKSYLVRNPPEAVFASYLIRIRPGERVLPEYVWWYFQSSGYWASVFTGIDEGNRPNMNGSKLAALHIPFPISEDEQRRIVARLDALAAKHAQLRRLQTETGAELAAFTPALLAKAFCGEL